MNWAIAVALVSIGVIVGLAGVYRARRDQARARAQIQDLERQLSEELRAVRLGGADPPTSSGDDRDAAVVPVPSPPPALVEVLARDECVLFAGAGCAASAGLPTWSELLRGIIRQLASESADPSWESLERRLDDGQTDLVAQVLRGRLSAEELTKAAAAVYADAEGHPSWLLEALRRLPFVGVVTDDWSTRLVEAFADRSPIRLSGYNSGEGSAALRSGRFFVLHAYGAIDFGALILSSDDYERVIAADRDFALFVGGVAATRSILFIGTSLAGIEQFCKGSGIQEPGSRRHYALVPYEPGLELQKERFANRYGVELLPYPRDAEHSAVQQFVEALASGLRAGEAEGAVRPPEQLERIQLTNIGPFKSLDLKLNEKWSLIIGDNAVGKTTILRAVALALAGSSPQTAVVPSRLLHSGEASGSIEVKFGGSTYKTVLVRERDHVRADAAQLATPLQSGAWLVVGLPAIRGVSKANPRGIATIRDPTPSVTDLLPLLEDGVDTRLDDLKSWVATHWLLSRDASDPGRTRHGEILEAFFDVLRRLTPGIEFEFLGVEPETGRLLIVAPGDGEISFDELSRGVSAMLGGIGVVLQRLYEVYPDDETPQRRNALLVIDEVDAHLHPEWQSRFLPLLRKTFSGLHLLATTHSPLIVANAEQGELFHLRREDGLIKARPVDVPSGWRADQILTGPAFELDTTMDRKTAQKLEDYRELQSTAERGPEDQAQLETLASELGATIPRPHETPLERRAAELLEEWLDDRLRSAPEDQKKRLIEAVKAEDARLDSRTEPDR